MFEHHSTRSSCVKANYCLGDVLGENCPKYSCCLRIQPARFWTRCSILSGLASLITIAANIGEVAMTSFDVACLDSIVVVRAKSDICQVWLKYALSSRKRELETFAT